MGEIVSEAVFSHEVYGEGFYEFYVRVMRLSGQADVLPVTISERLIEGSHAFTKLKFESEFQQLSPGGAISYVEVPNMQDNIPARSSYRTEGKCHHW